MTEKNNQRKTDIQLNIQPNSSLLKFYHQHCSSEYPIESPNTFFALAEELHKANREEKQ